MAKYVFPAVFTPEDIGGYSINFPDLPSCYTQGDDLKDGYKMIWKTNTRLYPRPPIQQASTWSLGSLPR